MVISFKDISVELRQAYIYISFKSLSWLISPSDFLYNIIYINIIIKTDCRGPLLILFPLIPSTRVYYLITARTRISVETRLSRLY